MKRGHRDGEEYIGREFGARVRLLRTSHRISQQALADACGIPDNSLVARYEKGERMPTLIDAVLIAEALGVKLDDLIPSDRPERVAKKRMTCATVAPGIERREQA